MSNVAVVEQKRRLLWLLAIPGRRAAEKPHTHRISAVDGERNRLSDSHRFSTARAVVITMRGL
jgi:hypothetical protein